MTGPLDFDEDAAKRLEAIYHSADAVRRRRIVRDAIAAAPGERVLDVGCGPGFYCLELSEDVGASGTVVGVDSSPAMLELARRRCAGRRGIDLREGEATTVPARDGEVDAVISVQVLEYVADVGAALAELLRVLRPGGRALVFATDWATLAVHSEDAARSARVLAAWDEHLAHRSLPHTLAPRLRAAGFEDVRMTAHPHTTIEFDPDRFGAALVPFIAAFAEGRAGLEPGEAQAWADEQRALGERGAFWFSVTQACFTARRPG